MKGISRRGVFRLLVGAGVLLGLVSGPAHAATSHQATAAALTGSIVYARAGNIWIARPDGSHQHQISKGGTAKKPFQYPSQSDNGTVLAVQNYTTLYRMDRNGHLLGKKLKVATGVSNNFPLHTLAFEPTLSPNGQTMAVSILQFAGQIDPITGIRSSNIQAQYIQYYSTATGKRTAQLSLAGTYLTSPSWIDNSHLLLFAPYNISAAEVYYVQPNGKGHDWFADTMDGDGFFDRKNLDQGELSRQGDKLALVRGTNLNNDWRNASIQIYTVSGTTAAPTPLCTYHAQHGALARPTWSPDGSTLAWSDSNGVWISPVNASSPNCGLAPKLLIKGAAYPDWGPTGVAR